VLKRSWAGEVRNISLLVAISVNADGFSPTVISHFVRAGNVGSGVPTI
jgi:hypothetical protein